jgi:hypothetical protein
MRYRFTITAKDIATAQQIAQEVRAVGAVVYGQVKNRPTFSGRADNQDIANSVSQICLAHAAQVTFTPLN